MINAESIRTIEERRAHVNMRPGELIDEAAWRGAQNRVRLAARRSDVFRKGPPLEDFSLTAMGKTSLTPNSAASTQRQQEAVGSVENREGRT